MGASKPATPRHVAIAVAVQSDKPDLSDAKVCIVSSRKHKHAFVLPKGGVESGESAREAAQRELWEEAGVRAPLPVPAWVPASGAELSLRDTKAHAKSPTADANDAAFVPSTVYTVHEFQVTSDAAAAHCLESDERTREFVPWQEARARVAWRRGMADALDRAYFVQRTQGI